MWHHGCVYIAVSLFHLAFFFFRFCPSFLCLYLHFFHSGSGRTFKDKLKTLILMHKLAYSVFLSIPGASKYVFSSDKYIFSYLHFYYPRYLTHASITVRFTPQLTSDCHQSIFHFKSSQSPPEGDTIYCSRMEIQSS